MHLEENHKTETDVGLLGEAVAACDKREVCAEERWRLAAGGIAATA